VAKIPLALLDQIVADEVGGTGQVERRTGEQLNPISITIREAVRELGYDAAVYWIHGGMPEVFSMPGFDPAAVSFSSRCVEVGSTLKRLLENVGSMGNTVVPVSKQVFLEIMAELALKNGDGATAVFLISQAALASPVVTFAPSNLAGLEMEQYGETYIAVWFYGLLHELGHVRAERNPDRGGVSPEYLRWLADIAVPDRYASVVREAREAAEPNARYPLNEEHLRKEVIADRFAADIMWRVTEAVLDLEKRRESFDPFALAFEMLDMFDVFGVMSTCKLIADHASKLGSDIRDEMSLGLAHQVRLNDVIRHAAELLAVHEVPAAGRRLDADEWLRVLGRIYTERRGRWSEIEAGRDQAMRIALCRWEQEPDCGSALVRRLREKMPLVERVLLSRLLDLAGALSIDHPDLRKLDTVVKSPDAEPDTDSYRVPLVFILDDFHLPLGVDSRYGYLIFAFTSNSESYADYLRLAWRGLPPEAAIQEASIRCNWEYELTTICLGLLPDELRLKARIVVEGTPLFRRLMGELSDGTIWAQA
jgi:hypothetical protein